MIQENVIIQPGIAQGGSFVAIGTILALLLANIFLPAYATTSLSLLYVVMYIILTHFTIPRGMSQYLAIPVILLLIGIAGSAGNDIYDVLKDGWYFLNPVITLCAGYLAMNKIKRIEPMLKMFVVGGTLLSLLHLMLVLSDISFLFIASVEELHQEKKYGFLLSAISLAVMLIANRKGIELFQGRHKKAFVNMIILINVSAVFLSFVRTFWLAFLILYLFGTGMLLQKKMRWLIILGGMVVAFQIFILIAPKDQLSTATMVGKIANSMNEILITDYYSKVDMQRHWRGYESYMAMQTYVDGNVLNLIAGHGFGKLVDLKIAMKLGTETFRFIPILHNGYMYLLVKTGLTGVVLYLLYLAKFSLSGLYYAKSADNYLIFTGNMIVALAAVLLVTTFVAAGMFNKSMFYPVMLLLGCLLSYARMRNAELAEGENI